MRRAAAAAVVLLALAAAPAAHADALDVRLQAVADGLVSDVFVGQGLFGGQQPFYVPGTALTVQLPRRTARTYVAGLADLAAGRRVRPDAPQPIGSGTKPLTAVLVLRLVEQGRYGVDDELTALAARHRRDGGRLARLARAYAARLRGVSVRELLNMTSGLQDYDDDPAFGRAFARGPRAARSLAQLAGYGLARRRLFAPGARNRTYYSNTNYALLGMLVEAVTGRAYGSELQALFRRAGMRHSSYPRGALSGVVRGYQPPYPTGRPLPPVVQPLLRLPALTSRVTPRTVLVVSDDPLAEGPTIAVGPAPPAVRARFGGASDVTRQDVTAAFRLQGIAAAAGGAVSTTRDLARFWRALFAGRVLRPATVRLMRASAPAPPNPRGVRNYYGLGFQRQDVAPGAFWPGSPRLRIWMKLGDIFGWTSASYYVEGPRPYGGVVVTNTTNLFPSPVGDLGVLRVTLRALA